MSVCLSVTVYSDRDFVVAQSQEFILAIERPGNVIKIYIPLVSGIY